jgi:hypothetical protein
MELELNNLKQNDKQRNSQQKPQIECCGSKLTNETGECCGALEEDSTDVTEITI